MESTLYEPIGVWSPVVDADFLAKQEEMQEKWIVMRLERRVENLERRLQALEAKP